MLRKFSFLLSFFVSVAMVSLSYGALFTAHAEPISFESAGDVSQYTDIEGYRHGGGVLKEIAGVIDSPLSQTETDLGWLVSIAGLKNYTRPLKPIVPQKNFQILIPGCYDIEDVYIGSGVVKQGRTSGALVRSREAKKWTGKDALGDRQGNDKDSASSVSSPYPGKWLTYNAGYDGDNTVINIQLYPVQWNTETFELLFLSDYKIMIGGKEKAPLKSLRMKRRASSGSTDADHIILSTAAWSSTAEKIERFNREKCGVEAKVVIVEDIYTEYYPAEDPDEPGYANRSNPALDKYDYECAKKIIAYLRDTAMHPKLKSVTILGSADIIPPSYYFYYAREEDDSEENYYDDWKPSDIYYASFDYDWINNIAVSRISLQHIEELETYLAKTVNWSNHLYGNWIRKASLAGGQPFNSEYYFGEMMNNQMVCEDIFSGFSVEKFEKTMGNFTVEDFENHFKNDDFLLYFHVDHGSGSGLYFPSGDCVTSEDLIQKYPSKKRLPVFLTIACTDGAFDTALYTGLEEEIDGIPFSEGVLASEGAGVAYIGGSRTNYGQSLFTLKDGNIEYTGKNYMFSLLSGFFRAYRNNEAPDSSLGMLFKSAKDRFITENDMDDVVNKATYVQAVLLGDGALVLPEPPPAGISKPVPEISLVESFNNAYSKYQIVNMPSSGVPQYSISDDEFHDIHSVNITDTRLAGNTARTIRSRQSSFSLEGLTGDQLILNKIIGHDLKEAWHYSIVNKADIKIDGIMDEWSTAFLADSGRADNITPRSFDLTSVYTRIDDDKIYFGLPVKPLEDDCKDRHNLYYVLAVDDAPYGFSGSHDTEAQFPLRCFPEFENAGINKLFILSVTVEDSKITGHNGYYSKFDSGEKWSRMISLNACGGLYSLTDNFFELSLPKTALNLDDCRMTVFSTTDDGIIEDVLPESPESPSEVLFGKENAYAVSSYIILSDNPVLNIRANGSNGPVMVSSGTPVSIGIDLNPGSRAGDDADLWLTAKTSSDSSTEWFSYVSSGDWVPGLHPFRQEKLCKFTMDELLNMALPSGDYVFYFGADNPDSAAVGPWLGLDSVQVSVGSDITDYSEPDSWVRLPGKIEHPVDVFYAYPTVYMDPDPPNMDIHDLKNRQDVVSKTNEQMGLYSPMTNIFVPFYRQMYRDGFNDLPQDEAEKLLNTAYEDVETAFDYYMNNYNEGRPFILVGHSQGAGILVDLMRKKFDDENILSKMVAAYTTGVSIMPDDTVNYPWIKIAQSENDIGVVIVYNTLDFKHYESSSFVSGTLCVNPLLWTTDNTYGGTVENLGAVWTDENGNITKEIPRFTDAWIRDDGALAVSIPNPEDYYDPDRQPFGGYHDYDQVFFYRNLQKNVQTRIDSFFKR